MNIQEPAWNKKGRVDARPLDYICNTKFIPLQKKHLVLLPLEQQ